MNNQLTIENAADYLKGMYFTDVTYQTSINKILYFSAIDEDDREKEIAFEPMKDGKVCVSVKQDGTWSILEILRD